MTRGPATGRAVVYAAPTARLGLAAGLSVPQGPTPGKTTDDRGYHSGRPASLRCCHVTLPTVTGLAHGQAGSRVQQWAQDAAVRGVDEGFPAVFASGPGW